MLRSRAGPKRAEEARGAPSLTARHEGVDNRRIGEGGSIAETAGLPLRDLPQYSPHDFARTRLWKSRCELNFFGCGERADVVAHLRDQVFAQSIVPFFTGIQRDE